MEKETLANYGWVVISLITLFIMMTLAAPFAATIKGNVVGITNNLMSGDGEAEHLIGHIQESGSKETVSDTAATKLTITAPTGDSVSAPTYISENVCLVSGVASAGGGIKNVTVNGATVNVNADGSWQYALTNLNVGTVTTVTITATDNLDRTITALRYVCYDGSGPVVSISAPANTTADTPMIITTGSFVVSGSALSVSGIKSVVINGTNVNINAGGAWSYVLSNIAPGVLTPVTVVTTDNLGKTVTEICYLFRQRPMSTFTMCGSSYEFEVGMTFKEWCASPYNTDGYWCHDEYPFVLIASNNNVIYYFASGNVDNLDERESVIDNSIIKSTGAYDDLY